MSTTREWIDERTAVEVIKSSGGKFFAAVTRKRTNGQFRKFNCRLGVQKGVTGAGMAYKPADYKLITVWDGYARQFRMIALDNLIMLKVNGQKYYVKHDSK